ncbi:MAG: signal peptidase II [Alphaproteobacteria bacterium]|nr:signal peptidase II [Alphaproteobacteria bacterium]
MIFGIIAIIFAFCADQLTKYLLASSMATGTTVAYGDFFNWVKVWNTGVSFSMFNNHGDIGRVALCILSAVVCVFLLHWMIKEKSTLKVIALGLIIGGALGNVADRIRFGAVLDFLDFHIGRYHWPAFNLADSFICIGAGILIFWELYNAQQKGIKEK